MTDRITVKPGEIIDRVSGKVAAMPTMPISRTESVTRDDPRWEQAVANNHGTESHTFVKQPDGTFAREVD
jgi:hypothetical protein